MMDVPITGAHWKDYGASFSPISKLNYPGPNDEMTGDISRLMGCS
jgi:hypothetical protein